VARNFSLFGFAFCYLYTAGILLMPIEAPAGLVMLIAFCLGLGVDAFGDTAGLHASASVLMAYSRHLILPWIAPPGGYEPHMEVSISTMGLRWYLLVALPTLFLHHFALFCISYARIDEVPMALLKSVLSVPLSLLVILLIQYWTLNNNKKDR